jgi:hypothetical protein
MVNVSIEDVRERLAQGWSFADATMGKGWESKYPHIAGWQGGYGSCGFGTGTKIWLEAYSVRPDVSGQHTTVYRLVEKVVPSSTQEEAAEAINDAIKKWNNERGAEAILRFKKGWIGQENWESKYPFISNWIKRSKRHCIYVEVNCVTGESQVKAWLYDKPSNKETILFETRRDNLTEPEILKILDVGIETWLRAHDSGIEK